MATNGLLRSIMQVMETSFCIALGMNCERVKAAMVDSGCRKIQAILFSLAIDCILKFIF